MSHHAGALWGFGLRIDPDYPKVTHFFPSLLSDTVLEYRSYGLVLAFAAVLAQASWPWPWLLLPFWLGVNIHRAGHWQSRAAFWTQAFRETPWKARTRQHYIEVRIHQLEDAMKAGASWHQLQVESDEIMALIQETCERAEMAGAGQIVAKRPGKSRQDRL